VLGTAWTGPADAPEDAAGNDAHEKKDPSGLKVDIKKEYAQQEIKTTTTTKEVSRTNDKPNYQTTVKETDQSRYNTNVTVKPEEVKPPKMERAGPGYNAKGRENLAARNDQRQQSYEQNVEKKNEEAKEKSRKASEAATDKKAQQEMLVRGGRKL